MPKKMIGLLLAALVLLICPLSAGALSTNSVPYTSYDYNFYKESISAPAGYVPSQKITAKSLGLEVDFAAPQDVYFDNRDSIYLLDSGNNRVIVLNTQFQLKTVLEQFVDAEGLPVTFNEAEGITVGNDGRIYIADTKGQRILVFGSDLKLIREIGRPDNAQLGEDLPFDVSKVMVDNRHNLYVLARSSNMGALVFDKDGQYLRYFGGNQVTRTGEVVMKYMLRPFLTQAQLEGMTTSTPININNFDVNDEGFVYTTTAVTNTTAVPEGTVRKLNYLGGNILDAELIFGDLEWDRLGRGQSAVTNFTDVDVDSDGFINLLDRGRGKVFQYTENGELLAVFGAYGSQFGTFTTPLALESVNGQVCVVDAGKNCLYLFDPTAYVQQYRSAILKLKKDDFEGSLEVWNGLLADNSNNAHAYYGIGRVYDMQGDYGTAMKYFKLAGDREAYSESFQEYRNITIKRLFLPIVGVLLVLYVGLKVLKFVRRKRPAKVTASAYSRMESKYAFPLYTLFHPMDGFSQLKPRKIGSWRVVTLLLVILFAVFTAEYFVTGYIFNLNRALDYNLLIMVLKTIGIALLFVVANWAVCTLLNGNGNLKEISCVLSYSLVPLLAAMIINVILSNFLSLSEGAIMNIILVIGIVWSFLLLMCGLYCIHEYTMTQTFFSVIATVIGMAIIVFLLIMFFSLMQQTISFFQSIIQEALTR